MPRARRQSEPRPGGDPTPPARQDAPLEESWSLTVGWSIGQMLRRAPAFAEARGWTVGAAPPFRVACLGYEQIPDLARPEADVVLIDDAAPLPANGTGDGVDLRLLNDPSRTQTYLAPLLATWPQVSLWAILAPTPVAGGRSHQSVWLVSGAGWVITSFHHSGTWLELADIVGPALPGQPPAPLAAEGTALARHRAPFQEGHASILSAHEFQAALAALQQSAHANVWRVVGDVAIYRKLGGFGAFVDVQRHGTGATPDSVLAELARAGGDALSDTYASITARYIAAGAPAEGLWINVNDILRDRGIVQLPAGGHRTEDRLTVGRHLAELTNWRLSSRLPSWKGKAGTRKRPFVVESSLLTVSDTVYQTVTDDEQVPIAVRCALGDYARYFLTNGAGQQTCLLMQAALRFDPTHERTQKRLAYHFAFRFRLAIDPPDAARLATLGDLLRDAHIDVDGPTQRANPTRTIQRWLDALQDLRREGIIAGYEIVPAQGTPPRGTLAAWLAQRIRITPPADIVAHYAARRQPAATALPDRPA